MRRKPSFAVLAYSLVGLTVFGFTVESLRNRIPPLKPNRLRFEASEYLVQGSRSAVDWRPFDSSAFAEARRTGKPILMLIGLPTSKAGRDADLQVFSDREVVSFLNRYLICIRIDALTAPQWVGAFLPLQRASMPMLTGLQFWFLTPEGQVYANGGELGTTVRLEPQSVTETLLRARTRLQQIRDGGETAPVAGAEQAADSLSLNEPSPVQPIGYGSLDQAIRIGANVRFGAFPFFDRVLLFPNVFRYVLLTGRWPDFRTLADALLASPMVDWLDGGFYRSITSSQPFVVEFDKSAFANAEMMSVLAKASVLVKDPLYRRLAEGIFDCLTQEFVLHGFISGGRVGDEVAMNRSNQNSFSPKRLREVLSKDELEFARDALGLRVETNPIMAVRIAQPRKALESPLFTDTIRKLRESRRGEFRYVAGRQLDVHAYVLARLLETARTLGDESRLLRVDDLFSRLDWFTADDDVKHTLEPGVADQPYLGDYLAYADACLQHYLAVGRSDSFDKGLRVLKRARFLFERGTAGVWFLNASANATGLGPKDADVPEVLDFLRESTTAQAIRLCSAYGRLLRDRDGKNREKQDLSNSLSQAASSAVAQFSAKSSQFGLLGASYYCSALKVADDSYALAVGIHAFELAQALFRRVPTRLVGIAMGEVRTDLQQKKPGLYILEGSETQGPLSVEEAERRLSKVYRQ